MSHRPWIVSGFQFAGIAAGIKESKVPDLALIYSEVPATVVGSFTTNRVQAAPVVVSRKNIRCGICRAVVVNSGNANACTGSAGLQDARAMVKKVAQELGVPEREVLVCSTGKIGIPLPIDRILKKIPEAVKGLGPHRFLKGARAILTTDNSVKIARAEGRIGNFPYRVLGFAKGAGMIEPHMATMLAFIVTDAYVPKPLLKQIFRRGVHETFNRISVDGDTSTNDTALILANGLAGNAGFDLKSAEGRSFTENLHRVMDSLSRQMVTDGEGATKCVRIQVRGARDDTEARRMAYTVANSPLVKTSFFGQDPNWGRILAACGRSGVDFDPTRVDIFYDRVCVAKNGLSTGAKRDREAKKVLRRKEFSVTVQCHQGRGSFSLYTSDLTLDYVKLNSCYRT